jgi:two-component system OmpR family response regulator
MKLLIIEDSQHLLRSLGTGLRKLGYAVDLVADGAEGLDYARLNDYDAIVLDLMLPTMDGLTVLQRLRALGKPTHILILSAKDRVEDRVRGLRLGADDYLVKPFSFDELCARIQSLVRRRYAAKNPDLAIGGVILHTAARTVSRDGRAVALTPAEYSIFEHLALRRGRVLSKEQLIDAMHDSDSCPGPNVIEVLVCTLRKKLGGEADNPIIKTRRGHGYCID